MQKEDDMGDYKLVALDMDGTLLNDRSEISPVNTEWIHKAQEAGVTVMFATGRGFQSALPYAEQLKLDTPMITVNGSEIWRRPHVLHRRTFLNGEVIRRLHELAVTYDTWFWAYTVEGIFNKEKWLNPDTDWNSQHWLKFGFYTEEDDVRPVILQAIQSWGGLEITNSSPWNLEINPEGVTKASAIREVCGILGIDMSEVVAMGDSLNDLAVIQEAGLGVAMGNAQDAVKAAADYVTLTNNENGVAHILKEIVLKG
jgi:Cof subfamily protein (haloacid dehalogenase superfamily)